MYSTFVTETPLGKIRAAACDGAIKGLWFIGQKYFPPAQVLETWKEVSIKASKASIDPVFLQLQNWLKDYFAGQKPAINFPIAPDGTEFQQAVWKLLLEIPYGETSTYGAIASQLMPAGKKSAQAVGGAVGHNPISLIIPCHRVIGADGSLTGYAGGLEKKIALLKLEKSFSAAPKNL
jgi:methylated-DNA-[protein]-cysteine S-methyltransferase